jgi:quercetin dioxygenase-like cupin family protein
MKRLQPLLLVLVFAAAWALWAEPSRQGYAGKIQVTPLLKTSVTSSGDPVAYLNTEQPEVTAVEVVIPPGAETGWHRHPVPCYAYILAGSLEVELEGGRKHELKAGQALVETVHIAHNGRNLGAEPVRLVMFVTGEKGKPFAVPLSSAPAGAK